MTDANFSQPIEADFIVTIKAKNGQFCLFFQAFVRDKGRDYLKHTPDIVEAKRLSKFMAQDVAEKVREEYLCNGRVERVSADNSKREPL